MRFLIVIFLGLSVFNSGCVSSIEGEKTVKKEIRDDSASKYKEDIGPRKRLMILPFLDSAVQRPQELRDEARKEFIKELNRTNQVVTVDSKDLKVDFSKLVKNEEYNMSELSREAHALGVAAVLEGKIMDLKVKRKSDEVGVFRQLKTKFEAIIRVRIFAARSAKELYNTTKTVTVEESNVRVAEAVDTDKFFQSNPEILEKLINEAFVDFIPQILTTIDRLSWEGRVAMVTGDRIFLNVGKISGLQIGDILKVNEDGDEVYDPQSGSYIGKTPGRLKGTLEVVSFFGQDGSIAVIHSGSGFKENDRVELY